MGNLRNRSPIVVSSAFSLSRQFSKTALDYPYSVANERAAVLRQISEIILDWEEIISCLFRRLFIVFLSVEVDLKVEAIDTSPRVL